MGASWFCETPGPTGWCERSRGCENTTTQLWHRHFVVSQGVVRGNGHMTFYMESSVVRAIPGEGNIVNIWGIAQVPAWTHGFMASTTGLTKHRIIVNMTSLGDSLEGDSSRLFSWSASSSWRYWSRSVQCVSCSIVTSILSLKLDDFRSKRSMRLASTRLTRRTWRRSSVRRRGLWQRLCYFRLDDDWT